MIHSKKTSDVHYRYLDMTGFYWEDNSRLWIPYSESGEKWDSFLKLLKIFLWPYSFSWQVFFRGSLHRAEAIGARGTTNVRTTESQQRSCGASASTLLRLPERTTTKTRVATHHTRTTSAQNRTSCSTGRSCNFSSTAMSRSSSTTIDEDCLYS